MNAELEMAIFGIISASGEAKSTSIAAISLAKNGDITGAKEKLAEIKKFRQIAQEHHSSLVQKEAQLMLGEIKKEDFSLSLLLVHAEDQMMSGEIIEIMAKEMIDMYEKLASK
ncbi:MAG: PTS lactose/cellobiose transporter subunit IIA [Alphaproteobacteria bacterium]|jgi:PTS system cellobiose-specific IIA component|nr:PTS lactose/cellobiose transporter subunit IIA [Alphaproteobacteria bacterium]